MNSGQLVPLQPAADFLSVANATFSPDGSKILYVYRSTDKQLQVVVRDVQSGAENVVLTQPAILGSANDTLVRGLDWVGNDTIYAATGPGAGTLLTLGSK